MATNDFQTFADGAGANVVTPSTWATTTARFLGFQSGTAPSAQVNTALRQPNFITAAIAQFVCDTLAQNVVDNGNLATFEAQFISAIQLSVGSPAQASLWHFGHDTGPVNVMQVPASPIITAYADGMTVSTFPHFSNTVSNPTLSTNGLAAAVIVHADGSALNIGDIAINTAIVFEYDAANLEWRIISQAAIPQAALSHFGVDVGTANAMSVGTVTPPIAAVTTGMQFVIKKGSAGNSGPLTLVIAGTAAAVTWADGTAFTGGEWPAITDGSIVYEGNYKLLSHPGKPAGAPAGERQNLLSVNDGSLPNSKRNITANQFIVGNSGGWSTLLNNVSVSVTSSISGAGGLDTGAVATSTIYYEYVITQANGASPAGLLSLSSTAPTLPANYVAWGRTGGVAITDSSGNFYRITLKDYTAQYIVTPATNTNRLPIICQGALGSGAGAPIPPWSVTLVAVSIASVIPTTASSARYAMTNIYGNSSLSVCCGALAPNANYGTTYPPPGWVGNQGNQGDAKIVEMLVESNNVYVASGTGTPANFAVSALGWTEGI